MHEFPILRDLVILVAVAIPVVAAAHRLRIPSIVGFLVTGMVIGPHGLRLIGHPDSVAGLAEVGVVLLLFAIGLELSLSRIARMGRLILQGGTLQVLGTVLAATIIGLAVALPLNQAVFYGTLVALSSTAIVLKVYSERRELDTPHGRILIAVLLFQDLCVVPLMLIVPLLAGTVQGFLPAVREIGTSLLVVGALVAVGRFLVPRVLERVATLRNREIFTLCIVFFGLAAAYLTATFGLSLALGAFIAGLVVSESEYGIQALSDILPFRDTFSGIFFIAVGMLLDTQFVIEHPALVFGAALAIVLIKSLVGAGATRSLKRSLQVSALSGLALAQVGEFSFILAGVGASLNLMPADAYQVFLGASVMTMLATPFVIASAPSMATVVSKIGHETAVAMHAHEAEEVAELSDHVIIVGYGLNGRNLGRVLRAAEIPYVILEQNAQVVRRARLDREPIFFGDGARLDVLEQVGITRARAIVFAISAPAEERQGVAAARRLSPGVRIIVRTRYVAAIEDLERAGADEVVPEEFETSIEIFTRVLRMYGVASNIIQRQAESLRDEHYGILRETGARSPRLDRLAHLSEQGGIDTVEVEADAPAIGESPMTLDLRRSTGATVIAVIRDGVPHYTPDPAFRFQEGDTVVLVGTRDILRAAVTFFRSPDRARLTGGYRLSPEDLPTAD